MNIFVLDHDPVKSAAYMCDKHVVKMIVETSQLLSTAHRVLDGKSTTVLSAKGRKIQRWIHPISNMNDFLCQAVMINHPCSIWTRESLHNYNWLLRHGNALCDEYEKRYKKIHSMKKLYENTFQFRPSALFDNPSEKGLTPFAQAMPEKYKVKDDAVKAYKNYYINEKSRFAKWKYSEVPDWYTEGLLELNNIKVPEVITNV